MRATLINNATGERIEVRSTTNHPSSSYGEPVWVDKNNIAYLQVDLEALNPIYSIEIDLIALRRYKLGQQISAIRRERGLSVRKLAQLANITPSSLSSIEHGNYSTGVDVLHRICDALKASLDITI